MKFDPTMAPREPLPAGSYTFECLSAEDTQSKNGNDMIAVKLQVMGPNYDVYVIDWLLQKMIHKLIHFCETTGLDAQCQAGELCAADCKGATGTVVLEIEEKSGFSPKNKVKDYEGKKPADQIITRKPAKPAVPAEPRKKLNWDEVRQRVAEKAQAEAATSSAPEAAEDVPF